MAWDSQPRELVNQTAFSLVTYEGKLWGEGEQQENQQRLRSDNQSYCWGQREFKTTLVYMKAYFIKIIYKIAMLKFEILLVDPYPGVYEQHMLFWVIK